MTISDIKCVRFSKSQNSTLIWPDVCLVDDCLVKIFVTWATHRSHKSHKQQQRPPHTSTLFWNQRKIRSIRLVRRISSGKCSIAVGRTFQKVPADWSLEITLSSTLHLPLPREHQEWQDRSCLRMFTSKFDLCHLQCRFPEIFWTLVSRFALVSFEFTKILQILWKFILFCSKTWFSCLQHVANYIRMSHTAPQGSSRGLGAVIG